MNKKVVLISSFILLCINFFWGCIFYFEKIDFIFFIIFTLLIPPIIYTMYFFIPTKKKIYNYLSALFTHLIVNNTAFWWFWKTIWNNLKSTEATPDYIVNIEICRIFPNIFYAGVFAFIYFCFGFFKKNSFKF